MRRLSDYTYTAALSTKWQWIKLQNWNQNLIRAQRTRGHKWWLLHLWDKFSFQLWQLGGFILPFSYSNFDGCGPALWRLLQLSLNASVAIIVHRNLLYIDTISFKTCPVNETPHSLSDHSFLSIKLMSCPAQIDTMSPLNAWNAPWNASNNLDWIDGRVLKRENYRQTSRTYNHHHSLQWIICK